MMQDPEPIRFPLALASVGIVAMGLIFFFSYNPLFSKQTQQQVADEALFDRQPHSILPPSVSVSEDDLRRANGGQYLSDELIVVGYSVLSCDKGQCAKDAGDVSKYEIGQKTTYSTRLLTSYQIVGVSDDGSHFVVSLPSDTENTGKQELLYVSRSDMTRIINEYRKTSRLFQKSVFREQVQEKWQTVLKEQERDREKAEQDIRSVQ